MAMPASMTYWQGWSAAVEFVAGALAATRTNPVEIELIQAGAEAALSGVLAGLRAAAGSDDSLAAALAALAQSLDIPQEIGDGIRAGQFGVPPGPGPDVAGVDRALRLSAACLTAAACLTETDLRPELERLGVPDPVRYELRYE